MAMCLLLPEISFLKKVNEMGKIEMVVVDEKAQRKLSDIFEVEEEIVELRIRELYKKVKRKRRSTTTRNYKFKWKRCSFGNNKKRVYRIHK